MITRRFTRSLASLALIPIAVVIAPGCSSELGEDDATTSASAQTAVEVVPAMRLADSQIRSASVDNDVASATYFWRLENFQVVATGAGSLSYVLTAGALSGVAVTGAVVVGVAVIAGAYYLIATTETNQNKWWAQPAVQTRDAIASAFAGFESWWTGYDTIDPAGALTSGPYPTLPLMGDSYATGALVEFAAQTNAATTTYTIKLENGRKAKSRCSQSIHDTIKAVKDQYCKNGNGLGDLYPTGVQGSIGGLARARNFTAAEWPRKCVETMDCSTLSAHVTAFDGCAQARARENACFVKSDGGHDFLEALMALGHSICSAIYVAKCSSAGPPLPSVWGNVPSYCSGNGTQAKVGRTIVANNPAGVPHTYLCANPFGSATFPPPERVMNQDEPVNEQWVDLGPAIEWDKLTFKTYLPVVTK